MCIYVSTHKIKVESPSSRKRVEGLWQSHVQLDFWKDRNSSKPRQPFHNGRRKAWRREEQKPEVASASGLGPGPGPAVFTPELLPDPACLPTSLDRTKLAKPSHLAAKFSQTEPVMKMTLTWWGIVAVSLQISFSQHPDGFLRCDPIGSQCFQSKANGQLLQLQWLLASFSVGRAPPRPIRFF